MANKSIYELSRIFLVSFSICLLGAGVANAQQSGVTLEKKSGQAKQSKVSAETWKKQAAAVSAKLGLSKEQSDSLAQTYVATREARKQALKELPKSDDESADQADKREQVNVKLRDQLKTAMSGVLSPDQIEEALLSLGSFNPRWDHYVSQIEEFQLDDQKKQDAVRLTYDYIVEYGKARNAATQAGSRFSSISARTLKATLDAGLAKLLNEEQLTKWNEATAFRGGGAKRSAPGEGKREGKQGGRKDRTATEVVLAQIATVQSFSVLTRLTNMQSLPLRLCGQNTWIVFLSIGLIFVPRTASAVILAEEDFSHPNGNLVGQIPAPGPGLAWSAHTDEGNTPIQVANGMASLSQGKGSGGREDANTEFAHQAIDATTYARFDFLLPSSLNGDIVNLDEEGSNFAHLKSSRLTNHFRARTGVLAPDGDGDFRLAINANGSRLNEGTAWGTGLNFDTVYRVVVNWNSATGESLLWLNPVDESSPSISSLGHSTMQVIESFTLRQSSDYVGTQLFDNLVVATTFTEALLGSNNAASDGDFDEDGDVDGQDFLVWQRNPDIGDLTGWQQNYGASNSLSATSTKIPEPTTGVIVIVQIMLLVLKPIDGLARLF